MTPLTDAAALEAFVRKTVAETTFTDIHTHLFPPAHGGLLLWGADEVLTYHYLVAELFTLAPASLTPDVFWAMPKRQQADLVWEHVFCKHGPLSEAARGALTVFKQLGLDISSRDLTSIRQWFDAQSADEYLETVFQIANIDYAVMTNNPFEAEEVAAWDAGLPVPDRLKTALRIDTLVLDWPKAANVMSAAGYATAAAFDATSAAEARRFLNDWVAHLGPMYLAASLPASFDYPVDDNSTRVLDEVVVPVAIEHGLPVAMMIGVKRGMNPSLKDGGDGVGVATVDSVANICAKYPNAKFIVTILSRVNQHELCVTARKFGNLHVEGCWWFCNNPSIIDEMTRMRLELLGTAFTAQHSDARVLDQLLYKWPHTRAILADVLVEKYCDLAATGWVVSEEDVARDVRALVGGSFEEFLAK